LSGKRARQPGPSTEVHNSKRLSSVHLGGKDGSSTRVLGPPSGDSHKCVRRHLGKEEDVGHGYDVTSQEEGSWLWVVVGCLPAYPSG
jgi:hypothetical protein